ncbi:formate dehydrogenase gamma subunit protein [Rhizobium sp. N1341]|nr:formate dehydrogenase gamma subunit protein [Rhizobium sp. N731]ANL11678.1 formate dehydrogenase gamma subunit protein [Rhizobium sp. N1341]ANL17749.1 formate dehydrogenase gamma subunit protein [Rhizobium sp. N1314]ANM42523.1 formate dehydrogenase gamma subunit protein [Rhizobium sp. N741]
MPVESAIPQRASGWEGCLMTIHIAEGDIAARTRSIVADLRSLEGPLLPILHQVQQEFGYVPQQALPVIAEELNLSRAEVHGVMTFYHDYRDHPAGRHVLKLCRAEACQSMGGDALAERIKALLGIDFHQTTLDGSVTLEAVYCLGLCACAPSAMLDGEVYGRLDDQMAAELVAEARR